MTDSCTSERDDSRFRHKHNESAHLPKQDPRIIETAAEQAPYLRGLLGANSLRRRGNTTLRASALQQAQRLHGNHAVQRLIQRRTSQDAVPVQRSPLDDDLGLPPCPLIPIGPQIGCKPLGRGGGSEPAKQPPTSPTLSPGKKGKPGKPAKGKKGGKPGETGSDGGFTITLDQLQKLTGMRIPLFPSDDVLGRRGPGGRW